jgi:translation initiation factor 3 subunit G
LSSSYGKTPTADQQVDEQEVKMRQALKSKNIMCRICKGEHFTSKCPYKDTLQPLDEIAASLEGVKNEGKKRSWMNSCD